MDARRFSNAVEAALVALAQAGDDGAFGELVRRREAWLRQLLRRLSGDPRLAALRPAERLCVVLCHAEGLSHAEISTTTGLPLGTVKSHVARGMARLRTMLGER